MPTTISYAVREGLLPKQTFAAYGSSGRATLCRIQGTGLRLETRALLKALSSARPNADEDFIVTISKRLQVALGSSAPTSEVVNLQRYLDRFPCKLQVGAPAQEVVEMLATAPIPKIVHHLEPEDISWAEENNARIVYTDGSTDSITDKAGGWGWYVDHELNASGQILHPTDSATAERYAVMHALNMLEGPLLVVSDYEDVTRSSSELHRVLGLDDPLDSVRGRLNSSQIRLTFVNSHSIHEGNNAADRLAVDARKDRQQALANDPDLFRAHHQQAAYAHAMTRKHSAKQTAKYAYCTEITRELTRGVYPNWDDLPKKTRKAIGDKAWGVAMAKYSKLQDA